MQEYITRKYFEDTVDYYLSHSNGAEHYAYGIIRGELRCAPSADVVEVKHGQIIQTIENGKMKRVFSCCNTDFTQLTMWITPNYCPNCGARMDGDVNV